MRTYILTPVHNSFIFFQLCLVLIDLYFQFPTCFRSERIIVSFVHSFFFFTSQSKGEEISPARTHPMTNRTHQIRTLGPRPAKFCRQSLVFCCCASRPPFSFATFRPTYGSCNTEFDEAKHRFVCNGRDTDSFP